MGVVEADWAFRRDGPMSNVRYGSKADIRAAKSHVRPESGHLSAKNASSQTYVCGFMILSGVNSREGHGILFLLPSKLLRPSLREVTAEREESLVKHPICKSCGVAMWLIEMRRSTKQYIYECKACNGRMEVDGK
jgi:hypothetical protein